MHWYDERQTLFSRMRLKKGTQAYESFYHAHPEYQEGDDAIRGMDFLQGMKKSEAFKAKHLPIFSNDDVFFKGLYDSVDAIPLNPEVVDVGEGFEAKIKAITKHYGAVDVGIVTLNEGHYYTHHGGVNEALGLKNYGEAITPRHKTAIVYAVPMDTAYIRRAPHFETLLGTMNAYFDVAVIGARLAGYLKGLGYPSLFQSEAYYETPLVPLGYDAGLGEIGMSNHLIHPRYGDGIRLGAVLTDLPLAADQPIDFGLETFCKRCALCLMNCPNQAIHFKQRRVQGRTFYHLDDQSCYALFKTAGSDCGLCIQSCPFTHGIDPKTVQWMKHTPHRIDSVLKDYLNKNGRRPKDKKTLKIVEE